ncbi:arylsulfatase B [Aestuariivirga sp.]|uniref:arylsulfatase B n=1 Tax=Aestuariivirga sp. TaxID=2650926 RepID=UPI0039E66E1B
MGISGGDCGPESCGAVDNRGRRQFLAGTASLIAAALVSRASHAQAATKQPNIVYIITDDQGWKDVGYHGSDIKTPNIDKLAAEGARLEQFYVQPMCTPTRAALMTGRYPFRYGLQTAVIPQGGTYGVAADEYLLPQMLRDAGYATAMSGKWHLGQAKTAMWPRQRGFDSFYGALLGEINHFTHRADNGTMDWFRNNKPLKEDGYDNILFGREAVRVINEHDGKKPLFLYLAFTAPHTPFQAPKEYLDRYSHIADESRRGYAAMISVVDDQVGKVVAALEKRGMRDNTLIVFQSDNGGVTNPMFAGESAVKGKLPADNGPYRDGKGTTYEGGTRVAALVNWPGKIKPGVFDGMMHVTDMYATMAAVAGSKAEKSKPLDGMDMLPAIADGAPPPRSEVVYNIEPMAGTVRQGDWKLVWKAVLPPKLELFDIAKDPSESTNLAEQNPDIVKKLQARIVELAAQMSPPLFLFDAVRLTTHSETALPDASEMFNVGD